jgi:multisubunit Na+/H+ antiporter MnhC subunit
MAAEALLMVAVVVVFAVAGPLVLYMLIQQETTDAETVDRDEAERRAQTQYRTDRDRRRRD